MSSQPPSGPPIGPLPPPPPGPGPLPGAGPGPPRWRSQKFLALIIVGAVVLAGLVVLLVVLLPGDGGGGTAGDSPSPTPPSPTSPSPLSSTEAHELAGRVALTPEDWGAGFSAASDGYEYSPEEYTVLENCQLVDKSNRPGTLASLARYVLNESSGFSAYSEARVYTDTTTAEKYTADTEETIHRCASQRYGEARVDDVREAAPPQLTGFDELVAEEGHVSVYGDGSKADDLYIVLTGRTGEIVLETQVSGPRKEFSETRKRAEDSLTLMRKRLRDDSAAPSY